MFLNLIMLAGIGGAVLPLVLHLLSRARYRTVDFGAMMFLTGLDTRHRSSGKLRQISLLSMRMAMIALLAIALARPALIKGGWRGFAGRSRVTAVVILDCSPSMSIDEAGRTRLDAARDVVLQILASLHPGDQVALLLAGEARRPIDLPTTNFQDIAARVAEVKPATASANFGDLLVDALNLFDRAESTDRQLYIVSDRQATTWKKLTGNFASTWQERLRRSSAPLHAYILPVGAQTADNVAIESLKLVDPPAIVNRPGEAQITLRNYSTQPQGELPITITSGDKIIAQTATTLPSRGAATVNVPVVFPAAGTQTIRASIKTTTLAGDDQLDGVVNISDPIKTLIISGDERAAPLESESYFLRLALMPFASHAQPKADLASVEIRPLEAWNPADLAKFQVVILANAIELSPAQLEALQNFVTAGGGLLIAPGSLTWTGSFNRTMFKDGAGLSPAAIEPPMTEIVQPARLGKLELAQPAMHALKAQPLPLRIDRWFNVQARSPRSQVLAWFASGAPYLIESAYGKGRVMLIASPLDGEAGELPRSEIFVPLIQSLVHDLGAGDQTQRGGEAGEEIILTVDPPITARRATITLPDGSHDSAAIISAGTGGEIRFTNTHQPGVYLISVKDPSGEKLFRYVVRPPRDESDLAPMELPQWSQLIGDLNFTEIDPASTKLQSQLAEARTGHEIWLPIMGAVLALSVLELAAARVWSTEGMS